MLLSIAGYVLLYAACLGAFFYGKKPESPAACGAPYTAQVNGWLRERSSRYETAQPAFS